MKIVFTAFRGKLKSEILDFPENTPDVFDMFIDMDVLPGIGIEDQMKWGSIVKRGRFSRTGRSFPMTDGRLYHEYVLSDILE